MLHNISGLEIQFNENQLAVVQASSEPLLVVAGPGAGKTTVLSARLERLLYESAAKKFKILGITFTTVAAAALRSHMQGINDAQRDRLEIGTFHAFAARVLRQHGSHVGVPPDFNIISTQQDRAEVVGSVMARLDIGGDPRKFLPLLERLYERDARSSDLGSILEQDEVPKEFGRIMDGYVAASIAKAQLDFSLLIYLCNDLLRRYPILAQQLRRVYRYICVDEFQDTNDAQFELLRLLVGTSAEGLLLLADQDQLIYQWNGASPRRLRDAMTTFNTSVLLLPTSFRCPKTILVPANMLIAHNSTRFVSPQFLSSSDRIGSIEVKDFSDESDERLWIAKYLAAVPENERPFTAVLARSRRLLEPCMRLCEGQGIPVVLPTPRYEFESAPLVMLHNMLRVACVPDSQAAFERFCGAFFQMTGRAADSLAIRAEAEANGVTPLETFFNIFGPKATSAAFAALAKVAVDRLVSRKDYRGLSEQLFTWVEHISKDKAPTAYMASYEDEKALWKEFEVRHRGLQSEGITLRDFVQAMDLESKSPSNEDKIAFLTAHGAKGLEFRRVILMGAAEEKFPAYQAVKLGAKSEAMEEERRSFFVAITRCSEDLKITFARRYGGYASFPSRFIGEMRLAD